MTTTDLSRIMLQKKIPYVKPLYSIDYKKEADVLTWIGDADFSLSQFYEPLFKEQKGNLATFIGTEISPNYSTPYQAVFSAIVNSYAQLDDININEMYRVVLDQVSLITSHELVPDVLPNTTSYDDRVCCNITRDWLESMNYDMNTEEKRFIWEVQKRIFGEAFVVVMWNANIGDLHPYAKEYVDEEIEMVDESGKEISDVKGIPVKIRKNMRIGDVEFVNPMPWDVQIDPDDEWYWFKDYVPVERLKKKYPKYNWDNQKAGTRYDPNSGADKDDPNRIVVFYLFHKSTEFMPEGRYIICTKDHVLVNEPLTMPTIINNQTDNLVRFQDLQIGVSNRGLPMLFRNCGNISDAYNDVTNQMYNNIEMESPKLFVHVTSGVDAQRMDNGITAIEWEGNHKPTIETPTTNTSSIFNFREALKKNIDEMSLQNPMVRGDTPNAQLDSFIALQHFEDQRTQLASPQIKAHIRCMEQIFRLMMTVARDKYQKDDGRLIKILGRHNSYQLKYFDPINLQKSYNVRITTTGNLANSKAARTQMMITIKREFPDTISTEQFVDALGLSHSKKFMNTITAAVSAAESENQDMLSGQKPLAPARFEDLVTHWETHRIPMQTPDFKQSPDQIKDLFIGHVAATEKLMFELASENPGFAARLDTLRQFPLFYTAKPVNEMPLLPGPGGSPEIPMDVPPSGSPEGSMPPQEQLNQLVG